MYCVTAISSSKQTREACLQIADIGDDWGARTWSVFGGGLEGRSYLFTLDWHLTLCELQRVFHILRELIKRAWVACPGRLCRLECHFLFHGGLHGLLCWSGWNGNILAENLLNSVETTPCLSSLREWLLLLQFFLFFHLFSGNLDRVLIVIGHVLDLTVEVGAFTNFTNLGASSVEILRGSYHSTVSVSEVFLDIDTVNHVLVWGFVRLISNDFSRLESDIMTGLDMSLGVLGSQNFFYWDFVRIINWNVGRLRQHGWVKVSLLDLLGGEVTWTDNDVTFFVSSGYRKRIYETVTNETYTL